MCSIVEVINESINQYVNKPLLNDVLNCFRVMCTCNILGWLPLLDLMVYIFVFNLGYGAMVWITVIEILPAHVREFCNRWAGLLVKISHIHTVLLQYFSCSTVSTVD